MKLSSILNNEAILQIDDPVDKWDVIRRTIERLGETSFVSDLDPELRGSFFDEVKKREDVGGTALGNGIAFPHARIRDLERPLVAFATVPCGVDFDAPDKQPVRMIFLILLPASRPELGVKIISVCSRFLMPEETRASLLDAPDADAVYGIIDDCSVEIDAPVIALDMMRKERVRLTRDIALNEATQLMHRSRAVASAVVDEEGHVIGELNCMHLLQRELPDYITHLHSVPHISDFHPFREYFTQDSRLIVGDKIEECDEAIVDEEASLLEIIFLLSVKKHPILYVCRDNRLIGVIDLITVVDKVLNI